MQDVIDTLTAKIERLEADVANLRQAAEAALTELNWIVEGAVRGGGKYEIARDGLRAALRETKGQ